MGSGRRLKEYRIFPVRQKILCRKFHHRKESASKPVYLTFDDGPDRRYTSAILDHLKRFNAKATFFVVGKRAVEHPDIVKRIVEDGHDIGNHTLSHPVSPILKYKVIENEIKVTGNIIRQITGKQPKLFRPTWLSWDLHARKMDRIARELGYYSLRWSISSMDWLGIKGIIKYKLFNANINSREILLFHDGAEKFPVSKRDATVDLLPEILDMLKKRNICSFKLSGFVSCIR